MTRRAGITVTLACVVLAATRLDVNRAVKQKLGARASFAPAESTRELTGMEIGGVTVFGLPSEMSIWVDARAIRQILNNLLTNAIKFTPKGGSIVLRALARDAETVEIAVIDSGVGIAAKDIPKVLEPFGQADNPLSRRQQGTGLGLPIVKALVELSAGRSANWLPVAGEKLLTLPVNVWPGMESMVRVTGCPACMWASCVSLKLATTHRSGSTMTSRVCPADTRLPTSTFLRPM